MGQQIAACEEVCRAPAVAAVPETSLQGLPVEIRLLAWFRRRSGINCNFGKIYAEMFGDRAAVGITTFTMVLQDHGFLDDAKSVFHFLDKGRKGLVGADEMDNWQKEVDEKEANELRHLRDFLKGRYSSPAKAYKDLGKGEGDVLTLDEFVESIKRIGFEADNNIELFRCIDKDFSGEITFAEFKEVMRVAGKASPRVDGSKAAKSPGRSSPKASPKPSPREEEKKARRGSSPDALREKRNGRSGLQRRLSV